MIAKALSTVSTITKILVVANEPQFQGLILQKFKNQIKARDLEFFFVQNGIQALSLLEQDKEIGIVLVDLMIPGMDGLAFLKELKQQNRIYRVIIITPYEEMGNIRKAMNVGANDFLTKPIDLDDLERTLIRNKGRLAILKNAERAHHEFLALSKEIEVAKGIQNFLLPTDFSHYAKGAPLEIYGKTSPTEQMGGDFFDFFALDPHHFGFFVGEVAESGIPAALFMTMTRTLLHTFALRNLSPSVCFENINKLLLVKEIAFAIFVTAFYGIIDLKTGEVRYCNAGHWPALILSKDGNLKEIGRYEGIPLAITEDPASLQVKFEEKNFRLNKGDCLLLYTNGVLETQNISRDMFGEERVKEAFRACENLSAEEIVDKVQGELGKFSGGMKQVTDVTLLALRYTAGRNDRPAVYNGESNG